MAGSVAGKSSPDMPAPRKIYRKVMQIQELNAVLGDHVLKCAGGPTKGKAVVLCLFCIAEEGGQQVINQVRVDVEVAQS
jgi:hypothetical protein